MRVAQISDFFAGANSLGPSPGLDNLLLFSKGFNKVGQGTSPYWSGPAAYNAQNYTHTFTGAQVQAPANFILNGGDLAFGFDPDCHFWNNVHFRDLYSTRSTAGSRTRHPFTVGIRINEYGVLRAPPQANKS